MGDVKSPELRHAEHTLMYKEFEQMREWRETFTNTITDAIARQSDIINQNSIETLKHLSTLERGIAEKTSTDSALMGRQSRIEKDYKDLEERQDRLMTASERLMMTAEKHGKEIDAAHEKIRVVEKRAEAIEKHGGNLAIKVLLGIGGVAGTVIITWLVTNALTAAMGVTP